MQEIERESSKKKLKKIISSEAELYPRKKMITKSTKHNANNNFFSKQTTLKDSNFSNQTSNLLHKAKSYTKFVDFFEESNYKQEKRKANPLQRKTSITSKTTENNSIKALELVYQNNNTPSFNLTMNKTNGILNNFFN